MFASLHVQRFARRDVAAAFPAFQRDARAFAGTPGLVASRHLTHGGGRHVGTLPDFSRLSTFAVWEDEAALDAALAGQPGALCSHRASHTWQVRLDPLRASGTWSGEELLGGSPTRRTPPGPVAVLTFIRVKATRMVPFWFGALPGPGKQVVGAPGLLQALWMVDVPYRTAVTFTLWDSGASMTRFSYRDGAHADVLRDRGSSDFLEFLAARFVPVSSSGDLDGIDPLARGATDAAPA